MVACGNDNGADTFNVVEVDNGYDAYPPSICVDSLGNTYVGYVHNNIIKLAKRTDGNEVDSFDTGWTTDITDNQVGSGLSLAVDGSTVLIFYSNQYNDIAYDIYNGSWRGENILDFHGNLSTVKSRWSYYHNQSYSSYGIDYLYSDGTDIYYNRLLYANNETVIYAASTGTGTINVNNNFTIGSTEDTVVTVFNDLVNNRDLNIVNVIITSKGKLVAPSSASFTITGSFTNNGSFEHSSGTVTFADNSKTSTLSYSANTTFYNVSITTGGKQMEFDEAQTTIVAGSLNIQGTNCTTGRIFLKSAVNDNDWQINVTGSHDIDYVDVKDSTAVTSLVANNSTSSGGNTGWTINAGACGGPTGPTLDQILRHGTWFDNQVKQPFTF